MFLMQKGALFFFSLWNATHSQHLPCLGHFSLGQVQSFVTRLCSHMVVKWVTADI